MENLEGNQLTNGWLNAIAMCKDCGVWPRKGRKCWVGKPVDVVEQVSVIQMEGAMVGLIQ